jgi:hypothetical protein
MMTSMAARLLGAAFLFTSALLVGPLAAPAAAAATPLVAPTTRDGHTDFDFLMGTWKTHYRRLRHILAGAHDWYRCEGTSVVTPFWRDHGNLEDGDLRCPQQYVQGLTLRLYDAKTHQWSLWWATARLGLVPPAQVGHFDGHGNGVFLADDVWHGRPIVVRFWWTMPRPGHPHFEQAFSTDHGRTWETNWTTDYDRVK